MSGWSKVSEAFKDPTKVFTGDLWGGDDKKREEEARKAALAAMQGVDVPDLPQLNAEGYQFQGGYNPATLQSGGTLQYDPVTAQRMTAVGMGPTDMNNVSTDPALRQQQMASLGALRDLADRGGMNLTDQANLAKVQAQSAQADRGRREAILANSHARGMGGGGQELLAQLSSSQAATDRQSQQGMDIAGQAQARALQAMMQGGNMAGDMRNQDFGEKARIAQARDAVAQFNAQQATGANQYNTGAANGMAQFNATNKLHTGQYNIDNTNRIGEYNANATTGAARYSADGRQAAADRTVGVHNMANEYNAGLPAKKFGMQMDRARGVSGGYNGMSDYYGGRSADKAAGFEKMVSLGAQGGAKGYDMYTHKKTKDDDGGVDPAQAASVAAMAAAHGAIVPGKAKVSGDSPANDTVHALVSPGEAIVPRSVMNESPDQIAEFLTKLKRTSKPKAHKAAAPDESSARMAAIAMLAKDGCK